MIRERSLYNTTLKISGPINPIGKTEVDATRFENLNEVCDMVHDLMRAIYNVSEKANHHEASQRKAGKFARQFLLNLADYTAPYPED